MKRLAILGASGHGKVVAEIAELSGWNEIVFYDDAYPEVLNIGVWFIKGGTDTLISDIKRYDGVIVAIGNNNIRFEKINFLKLHQAKLTSLFHPKSVISKYAHIGLGSVVMAGAVINPFAKLGLACIINTSATIDHDCELGDSVHISPGSNLAGAVKVGSKSWIGIGTCVKQCLSIGENVIIGSGASVVRNIPDDVVAVGVPAKIKKWENN